MASVMTSISEVYCTELSNVSPNPEEPDMSFKDKAV